MEHGVRQFHSSSAFLKKMCTHALLTRSATEQDGNYMKYLFIAFTLIQTPNFRQQGSTVSMYHSTVQPARAMFFNHQVGHHRLYLAPLRIPRSRRGIIPIKHALRAYTSPATLVKEDRLTFKIVLTVLSRPATCAVLRSLHLEVPNTEHTEGVG